MTTITDQDVIEYVTACMPNEDLDALDFDGIVKTLIQGFDITGEVSLSGENRRAVNPTFAFLDEAIDHDVFWGIVEAHALTYKAAASATK